MNQFISVADAKYMSGLVKDRHIESGAISIDCNWPCLGVSFKYRVSVFDGDAVIVEREFDTHDAAAEHAIAELRAATSVPSA